MKQVLEYLLPQIVDHPDDISVEEKVEERGTIYIIHANPEDVGKIIGKSGRIIRAIRDLVKVVATKHNAYVDVVLAEESTYQSETNEPTDK